MFVRPVARRKPKRVEVALADRRHRVAEQCDLTLERGHERRVAGQHAEVALRPRRVDLVDIAGETVWLQFAGSCKSCPSSAVTLELAVEDAIRVAAPEISSIELVAAEPTAQAVIPAESLLAKIKTANPNGAAAWHQVPDLSDLSPGEVGGFLVDEAAGLTVLACRVDDQLYAYRDNCPVCERSLAGAALHRVMGGADPVLRCPRCQAHFDVVHAGACIDHDADCHLDPIPLLTRDGVLSIAVPAEAMGAPA